jgi:hypothetical protein
VPLIALTIFSHQLYHVTKFNLSPWKGGGMGMFSSIAAPQNRFIKAYLIFGGVRHPVAVPGSKEGFSFLVEPTERNSEKLKEMLSRSVWSFTALDETPRKPILQSVSPVALERGGRTVIHPERVNLELWQLSYDPGTRTVRTLKIWDDTQ